MGEPLAVRVGLEPPEGWTTQWGPDGQALLVPPSPAPTLVTAFGYDFNRANVSTDVPAFAHPDAPAFYHRVYGDKVGTTPGIDPPSLTTGKIPEIVALALSLGLDPMQIWLDISWKGVKPLSYIVDYLQMVNFKCSISWWHEATDNDLNGSGAIDMVDATLYRQQTEVLQEARRLAGNPFVVGVGSTFSSWVFDHDNEEVDVRHYIVPDIDFLGGDRYNQRLDGYPTPPDTLDMILEEAAFHGVTPRIPEFGAKPLNGTNGTQPVDPTDEQRAEWMWDCAEYAVANGVDAVGWWGISGTRLIPGTPTYDAWADICRTGGVRSAV